MMVVHNQSWMGIAGRVDLTTPLGHETPKSSIAQAWLGERPCVSVSSKMSLSFLSFWVFYAYLCMVAMPTGYKLVISRVLGMHGIYCPQPLGTRPSGFGAINAIHSMCLWYNYYAYHVFEGARSWYISHSSLVVVLSILITGMYLHKRLWRYTCFPIYRSIIILLCILNHINYYYCCFILTFAPSSWCTFPARILFAL